MNEAKPNAAKSVAAESEGQEVKLNCPTDREYVDIINSDIKVDKKYIEESGQPAKILYYCKECKKPVTPKRIGKKLSFQCGECEKGKVSFGTENSIKSHYKIK